MGEPIDFQDWELLHSSDAAPNAAAGSPKAFGQSESDSEDGAIKADYFALDSEQRYPKRASLGRDSGAEEGEGLADSDNPSWVDPESDSRYLGLPKGEVGIGGIGLPATEPGGFWSDESSEGRRSAPRSEKGELAGAGESEIGVGSEGIVDAHQNSDGEGDKEGVSLGGIGESEGIEAGKEKPGEVGSDESVCMGGSSNSLVEMGNKNIGSENIGEGEKKGTVWWKLPLELLKFCAFRVKPVWSISVAVAIFGAVLLGRRLYKMKHKARSVPLKINIDDKRASQLKVHAARLNEAFSVVRRVPIIRASLPAGGVTPWPVVGFQ